MVQMKGGFANQPLMAIFHITPCPTHEVLDLTLSIVASPRPTARTMAMLPSKTETADHGASHTDTPYSRANTFPTAKTDDGSISRCDDLLRSCPP